MKRSVSIMWLGTTTLAFVLGYAVGPGRTAAVQNAAAGTQSAAPAAPSTAPLAGALPPGDYSRMKLSPDQGEPTLFAAADLRKAHTELQARAKAGGQALSNPRDLMKPMVTRTHSFILMHRPELRTATATPNAEQHEGVTDVYIVMAGSGTVTVGGEIPNKRIGRPGEFTGPISGGKPFKLQAGDVLDIPPDMPHATVPDPGGMTYILMKVNVGLYPWSLINGTP
jgi:mannose-6-phosphate isomerase-like protein (cupin superfamily)